MSKFIAIGICLFFGLIVSFGMHCEATKEVEELERWYAEMLKEREIE